MVVIWSRASKFLYLGNFLNALVDKIPNLSFMPNRRDICANHMLFFNLLKNNKVTLETELNNTRTVSNTNIVMTKLWKLMKGLINFIIWMTKYKM